MLWGWRFGANNGGNRGKSGRVGDWAGFWRFGQPSKYQEKRWILSATPKKNRKKVVDTDCGGHIISSIAICGLKSL